MTAVEKSSVGEPGGNHFPELLGKTALRGRGCQPPQAPPLLAGLRRSYGCSLSPSKNTVLGKGCVMLAYSRKKHPRSKQHKSRLGLCLGFLLQFFFFLQCLNRVLPEANTVCGNLQVLSYSSVRRRRRKVGSETRVEKHSLKKAGETSLPWFVVGFFFSSSFTCIQTKHCPGALSHLNPTSLRLGCYFSPAVRTRRVLRNDKLVLRPSQSYPA